MSAIPALKRFDVYVYKAKGPNDVPPDLSQIPAEATIDFYAQGATANNVNDITINPVPAIGSVPVWHVGTIESVDEVQVGTDPTMVLEVTGILYTVGGPAATFLVLNHGSGPVTVKRGDRLIRRSARPVIYHDPTGLVPTTDSFVSTDPLTGRATCYLREYRYDYVVTIAGLNELRLFIDADGSYVMRT